MKKGFRPTPNQFKNSMRIMSGNKTNTSLRDIEEDDKELEEKEATIVSIEKNKINGDGWTVKDKDGKTYKCSCQSNLYEIPKSKERGGLLYPTENVQCKIKINPVLNITTITEIITNDTKGTKTTSKNDNGKTKTETKKLDINKWTHKDQDTTVIAKPMSAISISNGAITFNFDDKNKITIDKDKTKIEGTVDLPESTTIGGQTPKFDEKDLDKAIQKTNTPKTKTTTYDYVNGKSDEIPVQATIQKAQQDVFSKERVVDNMLDQKKIPEETLKFPLLTKNLKLDENGNVIKDDNGNDITTGTMIDELTIYPDGIMTIKSNDDAKRQIHCTQTWITTNEKNIITITISNYCDYCGYLDDSTATYIDYCPYCKAWNSLEEQNGDIVCKQCGHSYCGACGHSKNDNNILRTYEDNYIVGSGDNCEYCKGILESEISKEYVDYCPQCNRWKVLQIDTVGMSNQIYCTNCDVHYCLVCGTSQLNYKELNPNNIEYDNYIKKMKKIRFIREN